MREHLTYANVMVTLLAIGALTGGVAYRQPDPAVPGLPPQGDVP